MTLSRIRDSVMLVVIACYLLFDAGFMLVRIPISGSIALPIGEAVLLMYLLSATDYSKLHRFSRSVMLLPFLIWWILGGIRAVDGFIHYGVWALRDATHLIESLFLWAGFVFASRPSAIERIGRSIPTFLTIAVIYCFFYPLREVLEQYSPMIHGLADYSAPLFFTYNLAATTLLLAATYLVLNKPRLLGNAATWIAAIIIAYTLVALQSRTTYLQIVAVLMLFVWYRRSELSKLTFAGIAGLALLVLAIEMRIPITGKFGEQISLEFFYHHVMTLFGVSSEGVEGAASGFWQRLDWWSVILRQVLATPQTALFGLGYGIPLTDFIFVNNALVREPHNSTLSTIGRIGFVGLLAFLWMQYVLFRIWVDAYRLSQRVNYEKGRNILLILMAFFAMTWTASIGEDAFEKPYFSVPYYFLWGVVVHYRYHLKQLVRASLHGTPRSTIPVAHAYPHRP